MGSYSRVFTVLAVTLVLLSSLCCSHGFSNNIETACNLLRTMFSCSRRTTLSTGRSRTADLVFSVTVLTSPSLLFCFTSQMWLRSHKFSIMSTMSPVLKWHLYFCSDCLLTYSNWTPIYCLLKNKLQRNRIKLSKMLVGGMGHTVDYTCIYFCLVINYHTGFHNTSMPHVQSSCFNIFPIVTKHSCNSSAK